MITITLNGVNTLNNSLQVGDMVYAIKTTQQTGSQDLQDTAGVGVTKIVGILSRITQGLGTVSLQVDESSFLPPNIPNNGDFLMFSKYDQTDGDVNGYYAEAKFKNNSKIKAELFSVGSEIIINSK